MTGFSDSRVTETLRWSCFEHQRVDRHFFKHRRVDGKRAHGVFARGAAALPRSGGVVWRKHAGIFAWRCRETARRNFVRLALG